MTGEGRAPGGLGPGAGTVGPRGRPAALTGVRRPPDRSLLAGDPVEVAPEVLGLLLVHGGRAGRIVEVEAYRGAADPASHAFGGMTARNATMFGQAGLLYVYFSYGMHWCANVVCGGEGEAGAVLLRALEPVAGLEEMRAARAARRRDGRPPADRDLCRGPANLTSALGIDKAHDGCDLLALGGDGPRLLRDGLAPAPPGRLGRGPRVGISRAAELPWRFWSAENPYVSGRSSAVVRVPGAAPPASSAPASRRP